MWNIQSDKNRQKIKNKKNATNLLKKMLFEPHNEKYIAVFRGLCGNEAEIKDYNVEMIEMWQELHVFEGGRL